MAITVNHSTPADGTFSATGATAWDANHTLAGVGTMATQDANAIAVTGGTINGTTIGITTASTGAFTYISTSGSTSTTPVLSYNASNCNIALGGTIASSYLQAVMQNKSGTANASTNWAVSNDLGTDSTYYGEFGMNSSVFSSGTPTDFFSLNNGIYFSGHDGDMTLGSGNGYKTFLAWGTVGQSAHVINASGALGLNTNITGTSNFGTSGQVLTSGGSAATPTWTTPTTGTVTSVGGTGTVSGISLSGTVTSSGNLTLGGTLDLSSPPTIGNTAPNTGAFTTLGSTGTATLASGSTTYVTITGDASYPMVKAAGGTNTPLVLSPLGTGALQAQKTDSTATGGNARGANAVDWQTSRNTAAKVASSQYSVIGGGTSNAATNYSSSSFGGEGNTASAVYSFAGSGASNTASGYGSSVIGGFANTAAGYWNVIGGGTSNSGTALAAVTTQSGTMNATTAVTLSGSNANIKVGQLITGTSIGNFTYVAAISGTSLTLSQAASGSSTSTLSFFTPHGVVVGGGNNQATGSYSFIGGGGDAGTAANRNVASGDWSVVAGGIKNTVSGFASVIAGGGSYGSALGGGNSITGNGSFIGSGWGNVVSGTGASVIGGSSNFASGTLSTVMGGYGSARGILGNTVFSASNAPVSGSVIGNAQSALLILARETTNATATVLTCDPNAAGTTNQVIMPNNSAYYFKGAVIAGVTGAGNTKGWSIEGVIKRGANAASTALVGTPTVVSTFADAGAATWAVTATADTTNGGLKITVTGQAATTIRWVCELDTTEMTY